MDGALEESALRLIISAHPSGDRFAAVRDFARLAKDVEALLPDWARIEGFDCDAQPLSFMPVSLLKEVATLPAGDYAECGVFLGGSAEQIAEFVPKGARLFLLDSFQGFPEPTEIDGPVGWERYAARHYSAPLSIVQRKFNGNTAVSIVPGFFRDTLRLLDKHVFRFIHADCDLYESYCEVLDFFVPRMVQGGIILFDAYDRAGKWPGAVKAIEERFPKEQLEQCETGRWYWRCTSPSPLCG